MKNKTRALLIIVFALGAVISLAFADGRSSLPDFSKAFPEDTLWNQTKSDGLETYSYATNREFKEVKKIFVQFLGGEWDGISMKDVMDDTPRGMTGSIIFTNPNYPRIEVGLAQMGMDFMGKKYLVNITVSTKMANLD